MRTHHRKIVVAPRLLHDTPDHQNIIQYTAQQAVAAASNSGML